MPFDAGCLPSFLLLDLFYPYTRHLPLLHVVLLSKLCDTICPILRLIVAHSPPVLFIFELRDLSIDSLSETPPTFFRAYQLLMLQCIKCLYTVQILEGHIYTALDYFPVALLVFIQ